MNWDSKFINLKLQVNLKKYSIFVIGICIIVPTFLMSDNRFCRYAIKDKKLYRICQSYSKVKVAGAVQAIYPLNQNGKNNASKIYYVSEKTDESNYYFGLIDNGTQSFEKKLPFDKKVSFLKIIFIQNTLYTLVRIKNQKRFLLEFKGDDLQLHIHESIYGLALIDGSVCLIQLKDDKPFIIYKNEKIPINIKGQLHIESVKDNRLLYVTGVIDETSMTEVVDLIKLKSIYLYAQNKEFLLPEKYNIVINTREVTEDVDDTSIVFYKVFIDGFEAGRTTSGIRKQKKFFTGKVNLGTHVVRLEKWKLDRIKKKYKRLNNIDQPKPIEVHVYENRIVEINVIFKNNSYSHVNKFLLK